MRVVIDGKLYDSTETPVLIVFHENEQVIFNMKRFISVPETMSLEDREKLISTDIKALIREDVRNILSELEEAKSNE